jgi:hypothetical protein
MSAFDWLQIALGIYYCIRRAITAFSSRLSCKPAARLLTVESTENAE